MTFKYYTTCNCCGTNEDVEMVRVSSDRELPLCPECADLHKYTNIGSKAAKIQQAEDRLIGVIKGE